MAISKADATVTKIGDCHTLTLRGNSLFLGTGGVTEVNLTTLATENTWSKYADAIAADDYDVFGAYAALIWRGHR